VHHQQYEPELSKSTMTDNALKNWIGGVATERSLLSILGGSVVIATEVGLTRKENQDRVGALLVQPNAAKAPFLCIALSDGMGGMRDGAACATLTIASLFKSLLSNHTTKAPNDRLKEATLYANRVVNDFARGSGGATLSAVLVGAHGPAWFVNVGDSRIYVLTENSPTLDRITVDDTLKEAFGGVGNQLVQFIGVGPSILPRIDLLPPGVKDVLLTSDGAHFVEPDLLRQVVIHANDPRRIAERITALSRWLGGPDNSSVCTLRLPDLMDHLNEAPPSVATVWSGASELQIIHDNQLDNRMIPSTNTLRDQASNRSEPSTPQQSRAKGKKRKHNKSKKRPQPAQLEIKIDNSDDGSDS
jgi:serine/threonine protein phosphatase PrpC